MSTIWAEEGSKAARSSKALVSFRMFVSLFFYFYRFFYVNYALPLSGLFFAFLHFYILGTITDDM